jgi:WD40 repeat protein
MTGNAYGAQTPFAHTPDVYAQQFTYPPTAGIAPGYSRQGRVGRRSALGWILGSAALVIAGGSAGFYLYTRSSQPGSGSSSGPALQILKGHSASVTSLSLLANGSRLATGSLDQTVRLWSTADGSSAGTIQAGAAVNALAWSPDGSKLASGQENKSLALWSASGSTIKRESGWGAAIKSLSWRNDGSLLFFGTSGNGLHALDISNYKHSGRNTPLVFINAIAQAPDGSLLALALESGRVSFADLNHNWAEIATIAPEHGAALSVAWSLDGSAIVVGYADGKAVVYNASTRNVQYLLKHNGAVHSVAWKPDSSAATPILVSGAADGTVNLWNLAKGSQIIYSGHSDAVLAVTWGTNLVASASKDRTAILWQQPTF